ncbi:MAG: uroporphyrinogen decarboxylase [Saprospiraceae bacterium]|jgi:uroporphyrinogen decarboxylase|nr:uroporphyrinogen decarboxylase [Saprospiraceae bacterium]
MNDLFLRTALGEKVERPPVWLMRQAGRILPQYRAIRNNLSGFKELVETPSLAAEVTIQPVDELGVDAAIIFSDILVIPEAMGLTYELIEKKGPWFPKTIQNKADIEKLEKGEVAAEKLKYVFDAVQITQKELNNRVPLIGFSGAPWTLLSYMIEGSGSKTFSKAKKFLYSEPQLAHLLLEKITDTVIAYLKLKINAGVDLVQIFDSWAGILSPEQYRTFALPYISKICNEIDEVPKTVFAKGAWFVLEDLGKLNCNVLGLDWNMTPQYNREIVGGQKVFQGNLDPCQLYATTDEIKKQTVKMLDSFGSKHIANLGHGVYPDTPLESVKCFVDTVKNYQYPLK